MEKLMQAMKEKIDTYKKNRDNLPLDVLKTRYAKSYKELTDGIAAGMSKITTHYAFENVRIKKIDIDRMLPLFDKAIEEYDLKHKVSEAVFKEFDFDKAVQIAKDFNQTKVALIYSNYIQEAADGEQTAENLDG